MIDKSHICVQSKPIKPTKVHLNQNYFLFPPLPDLDLDLLPPLPDLDLDLPTLPDLDLDLDLPLDPNLCPL